MNNNLFRRLSALLLAFALCLSLASCGGTSTPAPSSASSGAPAQAAAADPDVPEGYERVWLITKAVSLDSDGSPYYTTVYTYDEKGNVLREQTLDVNDMFLSGFACEYDDSGNTLLYQTLSGENEVSEWESYTYDENSNMLENVLYGADGSVQSRFVNTYNEQGNLLTSENYTGDVLDSRDESIYDENGNLLTYTTYDADGVIAYLDQNTYDAQGNRIRTETTYETNGIPSTFVTEAEFDDKGNLTLSKVYNDGFLTDRYEYQYDAQSRVTAYSMYEGNSTTAYSTSEFEYDSNGNRSRVISKSEGFLLSDTRYTYDENQNVLSSVSVDEKGQELSRSEYTYNENGDILTSTDYEYQEVIAREESEYDEAGHLLRSTVYDEAGTKISVIEYTCDDAGNYCSVRSYDAFGKLNDSNNFDYEWTSIVVPEGSYTPSEGPTIPGFESDDYGEYEDEFD